MKRAVFTGITGQDASYLAELLLSKGYDYGHESFAAQLALMIKDDWDGLDPGRSGSV
jgi:GDP-D-mannose dehydratase